MDRTYPPIRDAQRHEVDILRGEILGITFLTEDVDYFVLTSIILTILAAHS